MPTTVKNKYRFEFEAPVDLTSASSLVPVSLSLGDDTGSTNVKPEIKATH